MTGALVHHLTHAQHLINDLVHRQGALQPPFTGGAKATGHRAAHLAAHTHREPAFGGDAHGLEAEAVVGTQQQFGGAIAGDAAVQLPRATDPVGGTTGGLGGQLVPEGLWQHRYLVEAAGSLGVKPIVQLTAAEGGLTMANSPLLQGRQTHPQQGSG